MIEIPTIKQIIKAILDQPTSDDRRLKIIANEATIYYRTVIICEDRGIDDAMAYFMGTHTEDEYLDFMPDAQDNKNENESQPTTAH